MDRIIDDHFLKVKYYSYPSLGTLLHSLSQRIARFGISRHPCNKDETATTINHRKKTENEKKKQENTHKHDVVQPLNMWRSIKNHADDI